MGPISLIPPWVKLALIGAVLLGSAGAGAYVMHRFDEGKIADMEAAQAKASLAAQVRSTDISGQLSASAAKIDSDLAQSLDHTLYLTQIQIREVNHHVTPAIDRRYPLPCGFVRMHDAAILGVDPSELAAAACQRDDAVAPTTPSAFSQNDIEALGYCRAEHDQLTAARAYITQMTAIWNKARAGGH